MIFSYEQILELAAEHLAVKGSFKMQVTIPISYGFLVVDEFFIKSDGVIFYIITTKVCSG